MPTFGDYETVGEPVATRDERGHISTVWQARKIAAGDGRLFVVKFYAPHRRETRGGSSADALATDRGLEFLEGVKQLKQACQAGGSCLAPIHDFGTAEEGVWYATDLYRRGSLKAWIARKGGVDSSTLRHVIYSVAAGCLALKRLCGRSHGNLQAGNVFMVGKPRPLRKTPLVLADPYPASGAQILRLDTANRRTAGDPLQQVVEAQDLHDIGELIFQLVEGRLVLSKYDYNYPIESSPAWDNLGKNGERWRQLCDQLLDPRLSLAEVNLESLAKEFRPNRVIANLPLIVAVVGGIFLLAVGGSYATKWFAGRAAQNRLELANEAKANEQKYQAAMSEGKAALDGKDYANAMTQSAVALGIRPSDPAATKLRDDTQKELALANAVKAQEQKYRTAIREGKSAFEGKDYAKALTQANLALGIKPNDLTATNLKTEAQAKLDLAKLEKEKEQNYQAAIKEGQAAFDGKDYDKALTQANLALGLKPSDSAATNLKTKAQAKLDLAKIENEKEQNYQAAIKESQAAFNGKDYEKALTQANLALGLKPSDLAATGLKTKAEAKLDLAKIEKEKEENYRATMKEGQAAFDVKDYDKALMQANLALGIKPGDPTATNLKTKAQARLDLAKLENEKEQNYQAAIKESQAAFDGKDYDKALTQANLALGLKPNDLTATNLKTKAQAKLDLANLEKDKEQNYQAAIKEGQAAFDGKDYDKALTQANVALGIKPGDLAATNLKAKTQAKLDLAKLENEKEQNYQAAMKEGQAAFDGKDYDKALTQANLALGIKPGDFAATSLKTKTQAKLNLANLEKEQKYQTAIKEGKAAFEAKNYARARTNAEIALMVRPQDPEATKLRDDAQSQLDLADAANKSNPALAEADTTLEVYEVWFGIRSNEDPKLVYDKARQEIQIKSRNPPPFSKQIASLETTYRTLGKLDDQRKARLVAIREKLTNWTR